MPQSDVARNSSSHPQSYHDRKVDRSVQATEGLEVNPESSITLNVENSAGIIDKVWVVRVKRVVHETRSDPYSQVNQISQLQAEYLKEQYNKKTKVSEG